MIIVEIAGHLGQDAEERFTSTGKRVVSLNVASKTRKGGEEVTVWWRCSIWGDRYDKMLPYLKKGSAVIVLGEMSKPEVYTAKDGSQQVSMQMNAEIVKFSPFGKSDKQQQSGGSSSDAFNAHQGSGEELVAYAAPTGGGNDNEQAFDDLPF
jgi:single-strand DNA-binding protein